LQRARCANDNHGRSVVTVRCCPSCGQIVNASIPTRRCPDETHAIARRVGNTYCVKCGDRVMRDDRVMRGVMRGGPRR
jgi:rRNA maturation protein Nop10